MSHLRNIKIKFANVTEMKAVRGVLKEFGYPIYEAFAYATSTEQYNCAYIENTTGQSSVARAKVRDAAEHAKVVTLTEFIALQAAPVQTPAQKELAKLETQAKELNDQIAKLKATI